jgi:hypothetical protein
MGVFQFLNFLDAFSNRINSILMSFSFELIEELWGAVEILLSIDDGFCGSCGDDGDYLPFDTGRFCLLLDGLFDHHIVLIQHVDQYPDCGLFLYQHFDCFLDWGIGGVGLLVGDLLCAGLERDLDFGLSLHFASGLEMELI